MAKNELALVQKQITDQVEMKINSITEAGQLTLPSDYSAGNALKSAFLMLSETLDKDKKCVLVSCDRNSIANALFDMAIQGLSPSKKQCYFIAYGGKLQLQRSYFGDLALVKRVTGGKVDSVSSQVIYKKDNFAYSIKNGKKIIEKHTQEFGNIDNQEIIGAYACVTDEKGNVLWTEVMTLDEIKEAWGMGFNSPTNDKFNKGVDANGLMVTSTHSKFTQEMAKKTVIKRAIKTFTNSSSDESILMDAYQRTSDNEYLAPKVVSPEEMYKGVKDEANDCIVDIDIDNTPVDMPPTKEDAELPDQVQKGF